MHGGSYTWEKSKGKPTWVRERLDRLFGCSDWWIKFPACKLSLFHTIVSDHNPIFLDLVSTAFSSAKFRFKFENTWLKEQSFHDDVVKFWRSIPVMHLLPRLELVTSFMAKWGRNFFHKFREKIKSKKEVLQALANCDDQTSVNEFFQVKSELDKLLEHEEAYWQQRAKRFWLTEGDTNSKYFHAVASKRKGEARFLF